MSIGNTQDLERRLYVANGELGKDQNGNIINYVDGALAGIYFYDDPGNREKKVQPCKKLCIELVDTDEAGNEHRYTVVGRYDGSLGAASWFATTVADGMEKVTPGEWCRISVKAASGNTKVTFASVDLKVGNSWQRQRSETNYSLVEPVARGEMTYALITKHPAFYEGGKPAESTQEPQVSDEADESVEEPDSDPRGAPRGAKGGFFAIAKSIGVPIGSSDQDRYHRHMHYSKVLGFSVESGTSLTDEHWQILFEDAKKRQAEGAEEDPNYNPFGDESPEPAKDDPTLPMALQDDPTATASPEVAEATTSIGRGVYETMVEKAKTIGIDVSMAEHRHSWAKRAGLVKKDMGGEEFFTEPKWIETGNFDDFKRVDSVNVLGTWLAQRIAEIESQKAGVTS